MSRAKVVLLAAAMIRCIDPAEPLDRPVTPLPQIKSCVPVEWQPPAPEPLAYEVLETPKVRFRPSSACLAAGWGNG